MVYHLNTQNPAEPAKIKDFISDDRISNSMKSLIVGQDHAIDIIAPYVKEFNSGLSDESKPVGAFLLLGPTGVGKTETVRALAQTIHGSPNKMIRIDCGEFQENHEIAKLIGSPPGYLGHRETPAVLSEQNLLQNRSADSNLTIILFDEIEKGSPALQRILLGILDNAKVTLGNNVVTLMQNTIIFLTSNLGVVQAEGTDMGFGGVKTDSQDKKVKSKFKRTVLMAAKKHFAPEFMNRLSATLIYNRLSNAQYSTILDNAINAYVARVFHSRKIALLIGLSASARKKLLDIGVSEEYGAREINRTVKRVITSPVTELITSNYISLDSSIKFDYKNGEFQLDIKN